MSETAQAKFSCPSCGRQFTWKPELAGRSAKCKCGGTIKVPQQPQSASAPPSPTRAPAAAPAASDDGNPLDAYDFSTAETPAPKKASRGGGAAAAAVPVADSGMRCAARSNSLQPGAVLRVHCGVNLRTGKRMATVLAGDEAGPPRP